MYDTFTILALLGTFLIAGAVKGVIGLGLPTVSLALLTLAIDLPHAMALLLIPSFITNLWQAVIGGNGKAIMRRLWPLFLMVAATVWLGAGALTRVDLPLLSSLLGIILILYSTVSLAGLRITITERQEVWLGPLVGAVNGLITGMTGSFVVPGVLFLQAIGLSRDGLIQAMGILFFVSTLALGIALKGIGLLTIELGALSLFALLPAIIGMILGQNIRQRLSQQLFRNVFFVSLLLLGAYLVVVAVGGLVSGHSKAA